MLNIPAEQKNKEILENRVYDLMDHFDRFSDVMFRQQRSIYTNIAKSLCGINWSILEAGCGCGMGTAIIKESYPNRKVTGTDKVGRNVAMARCLYPWIPFGVWDLNKSWHSEPHDVVVCVEAIEHVADVNLAAKHLQDAALIEVWFSTPNGTGKPRPPENPYHVCEYTPHEILDLFPGAKLFDWETWEPVDVSTTTSPVVYQWKKPQ